MLEIDIPGFGKVRVKHVVTDYTGTLSVHGKLVAGVKDLLNKVSAILDVHVLTADTFGMARSELADLRCIIHILEGDREDLQKEEYVHKLGAENVVAIGNGNNDRKMLKAARIGIAVCLKEGCSLAAASAADILVTSTVDALDLLLQEKSLKATLRF
ncbi:MAG: HAD hydrolase family protein [Pseudomonadota bacterium]